MTNADREILFNAGPLQSYWWADEHEPVHLAIKAELVKAVDPCALGQAWENTKKVYPLIDLFPDDLDEEIVFYPSAGDSRPIRSRNMPKLMTEASFNKSVALIYDGKTVALSAYHSIADERGLTEIFKTLLYFYFSASSDSAVQIDGVMTEEHRRPEDYMIQNTLLAPRDYTPQRVVLYHNISEMFVDTSVESDPACAVTAGEMEFPAADVEPLSAATGAGLEEVFVYAAAKAIGKMFPDERRKLGVGVMTDFREVFGIPDTIAPCMKKMPLVLTHDQIMDADRESVLKAIAATRKLQKSADSIKTHVAMENTYGLLNLRNLCLALGCSGEFDLGVYTDEIKSISMTDCSLRSAFLIRLGGVVKVTVQYGCATDRYLDAIAGALNDLGIRAKITAKAYPIPAESDKKA